MKKIRKLAVLCAVHALMFSFTTVDYVYFRRTANSITPSRCLWAIPYT